jgi:regulatory protein
MTTEASEPPDPADPDADPESVARSIALRMLERQPRTRLELERAMARRDVPPDVAAAILDRFTEVGLVDDGAFAQAWVDSRHRGRGLARRALSAELRRRGVDETVLRDAVATVSDDDEHAAALALAERKLRTMSSLPRDVQLRRLVAMLGRKGFSSGLAMSVAREVLADQV